MEWLQVVGFGANLGAIGVVLMLLATGRLVARSWADALVTQANLTAEQARKAAEAADTRADLVQSAMIEQTAALRAIETVVRSAGMNQSGGWPPDRAQSSTWSPSPPGPRGQDSGMAS